MLTTLTDRDLARALDLARLDLLEKLSALRASRKHARALMDERKRRHAKAPFVLVVVARDGKRTAASQRK